MGSFLNAMLQTALVLVSHVGRHGWAVGFYTSNVQAVLAPVKGEMFETLPCDPSGPIGWCVCWLIGEGLPPGSAL